MAAAHRQSNSIGASAALINIPIALGSAVLAGSRLVAFVVWGAATDGVTSVSDTINGTTGWVRLPYSNAFETSGPTQGEFWTNPSSLAGSAPTITATFTSAQGFRALAVHEITGTDTKETTAAPASARLQSASAAFTSATITPTAPGCYIMGACSNDLDATVPVAAGGFTLRQVTTTQVTGTEDQVQAVAAAINASFTFGSPVNGTVHVVAFLPSGVTRPIAVPDYTAFPKQLISDRDQGLT